LNPVNPVTGLPGELAFIEGEQLGFADGSAAAGPYVRDVAA
jgi:hypothetical protein